MTMRLFLLSISKDRNWQIRFIEFMPFDGNNWDRSKTVSLEAILKTAESHYSQTKLND